MGLFDSVYAGCPRCGAKVEFQSKADDCPYMNRYTPHDAPTHILEDVLNSPEYCVKCGCWLALIDPAFPPSSNRPRPHPEVVQLRDLKEGEFSEHFQGMRWWNAPFSYADIASVDTHPKGQDAKQGLAGTEGSAVPPEEAGDAQPLSPSPPRTLKQ